MFEVPSSVNTKTKWPVSGEVLLFTYDRNNTDSDHLGMFEFFGIDELSELFSFGVQTTKNVWV